MGLTSEAVGPGVEFKSVKLGESPCWPIRFHFAMSNFLSSNHLTGSKEDPTCQPVSLLSWRPKGNLPRFTSQSSISVLIVYGQDMVRTLPGQREVLEIGANPIGLIGVPVREGRDGGVTLFPPIHTERRKAREVHSKR